MIDEKKYTITNLRPRYREFLEKTHTADVDDFMVYTENDLFLVLLRYTNIHCKSIYEISDYKFLLEIRQKMQSVSPWREVNEASYNRLSQTLKKYADFLQSDYFQEKFPAMKKAKKTTPPEPKPRELTEGAKKHIEAERAWRNPALRKLCIDHYGYQCQCCGMDFEKLYGEAGRCYIEVHHLRPISSYDGDHPVKPLVDLVPLCSNCHSMIHHGENGTMSLKELRNIYTGPTWEIAVKMDD